MQASRLLNQVRPVYPEPAKSAGIYGDVVLRTVISTAGVPLQIKIVSSPSDELSQAALEAVRQWRYSPTLLNGSPVEVLTEITINFSLSQ